MHKCCFRIRLTTEIARFLALLEIIVEIVVDENLLWGINNIGVTTSCARSLYKIEVENVWKCALSVILCFTVNIKFRIIDNAYIT